MKNLQTKANELNLTNLQTSALNEIGANIANGEENYFSVEDSLSDAEDVYLRKYLRNKGIVVVKDAGIELRGHLAKKWIAEHECAA